MRAVNFFLAVLAAAVVVFLAEYVEAVSPNNWSPALFLIACAFGAASLFNLVSVFTKSKSQKDESE